MWLNMLLMFICLYPQLVFYLVLLPRTLYLESPINHYLPAMQIDILRPS